MKNWSATWAALFRSKTFVKQVRSCKPLLDLVADDLEAINRIILDKAVSDVEMIPELAHHLIDSGGKRLRPMLALAAAKLCGYPGNGHIRNRLCGRIHAHGDTSP